MGRADAAGVGSAAVGSVAAGDAAGSSAAVGGTAGSSVAVGSAGDPAPGTDLSLMSRRNPLAPLSVLVVVSVVAFFVLDPATTGVLYLLALVGVAVVGRVPVMRMMRAHLLFGPFAVGIFSINAITRPGVPVADLGVVRLTDAGVSVGVALGLRVLLIGTLAVGFAARTDPVRLIVALQQNLRLSPRFGFAILTGHRMLSAMPEQWRTILAAHRMRAPLNRRGLARTGVRVWCRAAFGLLVVAIRRGERVAGSLEARGLTNGPRTYRRDVPFTGADVCFVGVAIAVTAAVVVASAAVGQLDGLGALAGPTRGVSGTDRRTPLGE